MSEPMLDVYNDITHSEQVAPAPFDLDEGWRRWFQVEDALSDAHAHPDDREKHLARAVALMAPDFRAALLSALQATR